MQPAHLAKVWIGISTILLFYTLNTWTSSQGGEALFRIALLSKAAGAGALFGIAVGSTLLALAAFIGRSYAMQHGVSWSDRVPRVWLTDLDVGTRGGRTYQFIVLVIFAVLPAAALVHFWQALQQQNLCDRLAPNAPVTLWQWSWNSLAADRFRLSATRPDCSDGVTFFPGLEPVVLAAFTLLAYVGLFCQFAAIFRPRNTVPPSAMVRREPAEPPLSAVDESLDFIDRDDILGQINTAFAKRDPLYFEKRGQARERLKELAETIQKFVEAKAPMHCAMQVWLEAKALTNYGENWSRVHDLIDRLERLTQKPDPSPLRQADDGSWGGCYQDFYFKLEPTVDALRPQALKGEPIKPLRFMQHLQDPAIVLAILYELQITDIGATGRNCRDELGAMISGLSQLIFKDEIRALLKNPAFGFDVRPALEESYRDFLRQTQHPRTGYWGPWYRFDGRLVMVQDLSFTFHIVNYLSGDVERWGAIIDTTLAIRELIYPAGWRPSAQERYSNHNNYDVIQIFAFGWSHMTRAQKTNASQAVVDMLEWCLGKSLQGDGFDDDASVDSYYYGVRFLDRAGVWDPAARFWLVGLDMPAPEVDPVDLVVRLSRGFDAVRDDSAESETVSGILDRACWLTGRGYADRSGNCQVGGKNSK